MPQQRRAIIIGPDGETRQFLCRLLTQAGYEAQGIEKDAQPPNDAELVLQIQRDAPHPTAKAPLAHAWKQARGLLQGALAGAQQRALHQAESIARRLGAEAYLARLRELLSLKNLEQDLRLKNAALEHLAEELRRANQELLRLAVTDSLTSLNNRRHFMEALRRECQRAQRYQHRLSLLFLDIDHFKNINDTFGHAAGDAVLIGLSKLLSSSVRRTDLLARLGGEEFAVAYVETNLENARIAAEALRAEVARTVFMHHQTPIHITISGGLVDFPRESFESHLDLLEAADRALYEAKTGGRDRIVVE